MLAGVYSGGEKITSIIEFRAGPEHNGMIYQCFAHNPTFFTEGASELNATIRLEVLCKSKSSKTSSLRSAKLFNLMICILKKYAHCGKKHHFGVKKIKQN